MAKLPEGRSALTDKQMIGLTHRLVDTCIDCKGRIEELEAKLAKANDRIQGLKELLWAAEKDANDAEAYAGELEAKLAKAMELANLVVEFSDRALWKVAKEVVLELKGEK